MSLASYILWHYTKSLKTGLRLWVNFIVFTFHFFSVPLLFRTYFLRFGRLGEEYKGGFDVENILTTFVVNSLMRIVGVLIRTVVILVGLIATLLVIVLGAILMVAWILLPLVIFLSFIYGLNLIL